MSFKDIQLINITLDEIRRSCTSIEEVRLISAISGANSKGENSYKEIVGKAAEQLKSTRQKLRDVLEDISNYRNAVGMLDEEEIDFTKNAYDLIYDEE